MAHTARTVGEALRGEPRRFLASLWPIRALAYVVSGAAIGALTLLWLPLALVFGAFVAAPALTSPLVAVERRRITLLGHVALPDPHHAAERRGLRAWLRTRYAEPVTWQELAYLVLQATVLLLVDAAATSLAFAPILLLVSGSFIRSESTAAPQIDVTDIVAAAIIVVLAAAALLLAGAAVCYLVALTALAHGELARRLLAPGDETTVRTLTRSRARLVNAFEVERRRIERDLHDGAQQRLLELGMTLVAAEWELEDDPGNAKHLVGRAREQARSALAELRELVKGVHPRVLTELGLEAAVSELADRSDVPVTVDLHLPRRLSTHVEAAAYFVVAEALTNAAKHSNATAILITGKLHTARLCVAVHDDGVGGADPDQGTGLTGLADRADAQGGTLSLSSPSGGPTILTLDLPCTD